MITSTEQLLHKSFPILGVSSLLEHHIESGDIEGEGVVEVVGKMWRQRNPVF